MKSSINHLSQFNQKKTEPYQNGFVLIAALIFLLVLSIFSVAMFRGFGLQDKIAGNIREKEKAFHAAESNLESGIASPYFTPAGYMETLPEVLTLAAKNTGAASSPKGRIISLYPQWRRISRTAAAAVLILGLGIASYSYFHSKVPEVIAKKQLSKLDPMIIDTYVSQHVDEFDAETLEATVASSQADAHAAISTLDESEIQEYLQETGEINNTAGDKETL